jgi:hypothetical protein
MENKHLEYFIKRMASLEDRRMYWESLWDKCAELCMPESRITSDPASDVGKTALADRSAIINGVGIKSLNRLASGMQSSLTNPSNRWFKLGSGDEDIDSQHDVKKWLYDAENVLYRAFSKSNFYSSTELLYRDLGGFGTGCMIILPDKENYINAVHVPVGRFYVATNERGVVDTVYRKFAFTARQMMLKFGYDKCSQQVRNCIDNNNLDMLFNIVHAIEPNTFEGLNIQHQFVNVYFEEGGSIGYSNSGVVMTAASPTNDFLKISGFHEQPFFVPKWRLVGDNDYGVCPAMDALSDLNMLQDLDADLLQGLSKQVEPPLKATPDVKSGGINIHPSGITFVSDRERSVLETTYNVVFDLNGVNVKSKETEQKIQEFFYNDLFNMIANTTKRMTAYEVQEKMGEKLQMLGSVADRLQYEYLDLVINRVFNILYRGGHIKEMPQELQESKLKIEYIGLLTQARKMKDASAIMNVLAFAGNLAGVKPEVLDILRFEEALMLIGSTQSVNPRIFKDMREVEEMRERRAEQQQQMAAVEQDMQTAQKAELLSRANLSGGGTALDAVMNEAAGM